MAPTCWCGGERIGDPHLHAARRVVRTAASVSSAPSLGLQVEPAAPVGPHVIILGWHASAHGLSAHEACPTMLATIRRCACSTSSTTVPKPNFPSGVYSRLNAAAARTRTSWMSTSASRRSIRQRAIHNWIRERTTGRARDGSNDWPGHCSGSPSQDPDSAPDSTGLALSSSCSSGYPPGIEPREAFEARGRQNIWHSRHLGTPRGACEPPVRTGEGILPAIRASTALKTGGMMDAGGVGALARTANAFALADARPRAVCAAARARLALC